MQVRGVLYRALNPYWAYRPLSGDGAAQFGGRFNRRGRQALYLADSPETALTESNQAGTLQPTTLVAVDVDLDAIFDARDAEALARFGESPASIGRNDWALVMDRDGIAPGQALAERLIADHFAGLRAPSHAPGAAPGAEILALWAWGETPPQRLTLIDEASRLRHPPAPPSAAPPSSDGRG